MKSFFICFKSDTFPKIKKKKMLRECLVLLKCDVTQFLALSESGYFISIAFTLIFKMNSFNLHPGFRHKL